MPSIITTNEINLQENHLSKSEFEQLADFRYQLRIFLRFSEQVAQEFDITALQYLLLLQIKGYPGREWATIGELAERLQSHHHGTVSLVSRCEKLGLVIRRASQVDKRCVEIALSEKGEGIVNLIAQRHKDQVQQLKDVLGRVYQTDSLTTSHHSTSVESKK